MTANYSHCIHNWPETREIGNSFKFRRVGSARYLHDASRPLLRIARFLLASWPVQQSSVEVTSKFRCGFNRHQPLLENLSVTPRFAFSACQCFTGYPTGNFIVMARSVSVALWRGRFSIPRFIVGICINFLVVSCTHLSFPCFLCLFRSALFLSKRKNHISYITGNNYDKSFVKQKDV